MRGKTTLLALNEYEETGEYGEILKPIGTVYIKASSIIYMRRYANYTGVFLTHVKDFIYVKETPEEIIAMINEGVDN